MHSQVLLLAAGLWLGFYTLTKIYKAVTSPERSIPGPFLARFTKLWFLYHIKRGSFHLDSQRLHKKYGPIVRIAPGWYEISTPDKTVYGISSHFPKGEWYEGWKHPSPDKFTLFADRDIQRHKETRRKFQSLYSLSSMLHYEGYVEECTEILRQRLEEKSRSGEGIDMAHWFLCWGYDVMAHVTYSSRFGFLDRGEDVAGIMAALDKNMKYSTMVGMYWRAHKYIFAILERVAGSGATGRPYIMRFITEKIAARNKEREKLGKGAASKRDIDGPTDFLDKMIDAHEQDPVKVNAYNILMMGMSNIVAGSDTTGIALTSILYYLLTTPRCMAILRDELDAAVMGEHGAGDKLDYKDASKLPYLQAVIKEALRIHPVAGLPLWREVPEGGSVVAGQQFSAGSFVGVQPWVANHDKSVFGDDAHVFRPERWLEEENDAEKLREMDAQAFSFGMGARTCIGQHVARLEMSKLIPDLVRRFEFKLDMPEGEWKANNCLFVKPEKLMVKVSERTVEHK